MKANDEEEYLTFAEFAKLLGVSEYQVRRYVHDGVIPILKLGYKVKRVPRKRAMEKLAELVA